MLLNLTRRCNMPALWQSSQRPMYIRTVWVDGFRHAILNHEDPCYLRLTSKRRPYSSPSTQTSTPTRPLKDLEDYRQLIVTNERKLETPIESLNLNDSEDDRKEDKPLSDIDICLDNMKAMKSKTARADVKENSELCDRVLQWLNLAGKVDIVKDDIGISRPHHNWTEIQRGGIIKSKTSTDLKARQEIKASGDIDRQEIYVTTNTIENYARQSRNAITRQDAKAKENRRVKGMKANIVKMAAEKNLAEKQYAELVSKKSADTGKAKKQVHIFMPESLPKRN